MKKALIAFGGNALIQADQLGIQSQQLENAKEAAEMMVHILKQGFLPIIVHGNGPQIGNVLLQQEAAANRVPPYTMDICGAQTQGSMGYILQRCIKNMIQLKKLDYDVATVLSEVVVDGSDAAFKNPTKPVGPFYAPFRAHELEKEKGWTVKEDSGRGWRRLVPSPAPLEIVQIRTIRQLVDDGQVVIACGGGGIPVKRDDSGYLQGVEAVIDKDRTSALLAHELNVDTFVILTGVPKVYLDFGTENQRAVDRITLSDAKRYLEEGQFPPGSMGPKMQAAIHYVEVSGSEVLITTAEELLYNDWDEVGTRIVPD